MWSREEPLAEQFCPGCRGEGWGSRVEGEPLDLLVNLGWRTCCKPSRKAQQGRLTSSPLPEGLFTARALLALRHSCSAMLRGQVVSGGAGTEGWGEESSETLIHVNAALSPRRGAPRQSLELQSLRSFPSDRSDWDGFTKKEGSRTESLLLSSWAVWPSD